MFQRIKETLRLRNLTIAELDEELHLRKELARKMYEIEVGELEQKYALMIHRINDANRLQS